MTARLDEFAWIDLLKPLTRGDSRALDLGDDAAVIPAQEGMYPLPIREWFLTS